MSRTASELPKRASPSTANVLDAREKLRRLSELPRETTSSTERENNEPNRARPTADRDERHGQCNKFTASITKTLTAQS